MRNANTPWVLIAPETTEDEETEDSEEKKPKTKTIKETTSEWELLNDVKAVWLRSPKEVTEEEYTKFYHSLAKVNTLVINSILTGHKKFRLYVRLVEETLCNIKIFL
jgi:HSP90 family molecular chaperone